jgi:hypothetical protein
VAAGIHATTTVDYDFLVEGSIELIADDGTATLQPGDGVVIVGARHGWRTAGEGCTVAILMTGVDALVS